MREGTCSKGPSFRFLCSLMVHRMPLAKNASWELVCHLNALLVNGNSSLANKTHVPHGSPLRNCLNHTCKKCSFKEINSKRFSILLFIFEKHCAIFSVKMFWQYYQMSSG